MPVGSWNLLHDPKRPSSHTHNHDRIVYYAYLLVFNLYNRYDHFLIGLGPLFLRRVRHRRLRDYITFMVAIRRLLLGSSVESSISLSDNT